MHHAQHVGLHAVLPQHVIGLDHLAVRRLAILGVTIDVMQFARAVDAQADGESFRRKKAAPFVIEHGAVGLHAITDASARRQIFFLKLDDALKNTLAIVVRGGSAAAGDESSNYRDGTNGLASDLAHGRKSS